MSNGSLVCLSKRNDGNGYVYIAKINHGNMNTEGCYKVGSTSNPYRRMSGLASNCIGSVELIAFGFTTRKLSTERYLQNTFRKESWKVEDPNEPLSFWWSMEHFRFDTQKLKHAIDMLKLVTISCEVWEIV